MKNEKMLELLNSYISSLGDYEKSIISRCSEAALAGVKYSNPLPVIALAMLKAGIEENIRNSAAKSSGKLAVLKAASRIIKSGKLDYPWTGDDGRQYFCSGYHMVALNEHLDLPDGKENHSVEKILSAESASCYSCRIEVPTVAYLKAYIKIEKVKSNKKKGDKVLYDFGDDLPVVDANFLLDILECLPEPLCYVRREHGTKSNIYFLSESGDGVLLPVIKNK